MCWAFKRHNTSSRSVASIIAFPHPSSGASPWQRPLRRRRAVIGRPGHAHSVLSRYPHARRAAAASRDGYGPRGGLPSRPGRATAAAPRGRHGVRTVPAEESPDAAETPHHREHPGSARRRRSPRPRPGHGVQW